MILQQEHFQYVTEDATIIPDGRNRLYYTEVSDYFHKDPFRNFSIKLLLQGNILYRMEKGEVNLHAGQCLLTYKQPGKMIVDSPESVRNISVDIELNTFKQALKRLTEKGIKNPGNITAEHFFSSSFFECVYTSRDTLMIQRLKKLLHDVLHGNALVTDETFLLIAEDVILLELQQYKRLASLTALNMSTKKELLKRLLKGKHFIDENCLSNPEIAIIAEQAQLSDYYFFRNFRSAFEQSPYQYMMDKRLAHAKQLILEGIPFTSVAKKCGFNDLFTFSKAFKRKYGMAPMRFKRGPLKK